MEAAAGARQRGKRPRELRTASVPAGDLRPPTVRRDPKHGDLLHQAVHAETLFLAGGTTAFRQAAQEIFTVTRDGPPHAATKHYLPGACNYHVCRSLYDWPELEEHDWDQVHVEFCPRWTS